MFERLTNPTYWKRIILANARSRHRSCRPIGSIFGWDAWALDGNVLLFHPKRHYCRRADWFDFCHSLRIWGAYGAFYTRDSTC